METKTIDNNEVKALIRLLDDTDSTVYQIVEQNLLKQGIAVVPELERAWENSLNELFHQRLENLIQKIQFDTTLSNLSEWHESGAENLLKGAYWVTKYQYPDLEYEDVYRQFEKISDDVWDEIGSYLTPLEQIRVVNHILFDVYQFSGNNANFYAPQNSYINHVLESRKGNPISLAIIYIIISQKVGLPIHGVNLPKNFILAFKNEQSKAVALGKEKYDDILFYINPYNKGAVLGKREIDFFIKQQNFKAQDSFYLPCENSIIIQRLILNLIFCYEKLGYPNKIADLKKLLKVFKKGLPEGEQY